MGEGWVHTRTQGQRPQPTPQKRRSCPLRNSDRMRGDAQRDYHITIIFSVFFFSTATGRPRLRYRPTEAAEDK